MLDDEEISARRVELFQRRHSIANIVSSVLTSVGAVEIVVERRYFSGLISFLAGLALASNKKDPSRLSALCGFLANLPQVYSYLSLGHDENSSGIAAFVFALRFACVVLLGKLAYYTRRLQILGEAQQERRQRK